MYAYTRDSDKDQIVKSWSVVVLFLKISTYVDIHQIQVVDMPFDNHTRIK